MESEARPVQDKIREAERRDKASSPIDMPLARCRDLRQESPKVRPTDSATRPGGVSFMAFACVRHLAQPSGNGGRRLKLSATPSPMLGARTQAHRAALCRSAEIDSEHGAIRDADRVLRGPARLSVAYDAAPGREGESLKIGCLRSKTASKSGWSSGGKRLSPQALRHPELAPASPGSRQPPIVVSDGVDIDRRAMSARRPSGKVRRSGVAFMTV